MEESKASPRKVQDFSDGTEGFLMSESSEGGDELLRIIRGFGNEFDQAQSFPTIITGTNEPRDALPCCCVRKEGERGDCTSLFATGYVGAILSFEHWMNHFAALCLLSKYTNISNVAAAAFSTSLMSVFYLPIRRGFPTALREACIKSQPYTPVDERNLWLQGIMILLVPILTAVSLAWGFGIEPLARVLSKTGRPIEEIARFAHFSILWLWPAAFLDCLWMYLYAKQIQTLRVIDAAISLVVPMLLTWAVLSQGSGIVGVPLALAASYSIRLIVMLTLGCIQGSIELPCNFSSWQLLPSTAPRRYGRPSLSSRAGLLNRSINSTPGATEVDEGPVNFFHAAFKLAPNAIIMGIVQSWKRDSALLMVSIFAWALGDVQMAAHGIVLSGMFMIVTSTGHPGLSKSIEDAVRHYWNRAQPTRVIRILQFSLTITAGLSILFNFTLILVLTVLNRRERFAVEDKIWQEAHRVMFLSAEFAVSFSTLSVIRGFLKGIGNLNYAMAALYAPAILSVILSFLMASVLNLGLFGIWLGMLIGNLMSLVACAVKACFTYRSWQTA
ncbi:hypothetical protein AAMO2058_000370400 [Amorphochlora amoebiformis]